MILNYYLFNALSLRRGTLYFYKILHWETQLFLSRCRWSCTVYPFPVTIKAETYSIINCFFLCHGGFLCKMEYYYILRSRIWNREQQLTLCLYTRNSHKFYRPISPKKLTICYLPKLCSSLKLSSSCTRSTSDCKVWSSCSVKSRTNENLSFKEKIIIYYTMNFCLQKFTC